MTFDEALRAAIGWRRAHKTWAEIGKLTGFDKDKLRLAAKKEGREDGWGDSLIEKPFTGPKGTAVPASSHSMGRFMRRK